MYLDDTTLNRAKYLRYLRENPKGREQITGLLSDGENGRCALGMCTDLIGSINEGGDYSEIAEFLDLDNDGLENIWRLNDRSECTFSEIADRMEQLWLRQIGQ